jgi:cob(I)alamin adenosyltransferase
MVRLTKIYTRTGDDGTTGLGSGERVLKFDLRVEVYGTVDEANATLGLAVIACERDAQRLPQQPLGSTLREVAALIRACQHDLFDLGADLCVPVSTGEAPGACLRIVVGQTQRLEHAIDRYNEPMAPLTSFILPGGSESSAALHLARTVVRRAERLCVELARRDPARTNGETVKYLNRLSDLLFVLGRVANDHGRHDVLWIPGANRDKSSPPESAHSANPT